MLLIYSIFFNNLPSYWQKCLESPLTSLTPKVMKNNSDCCMCSPLTWEWASWVGSRKGTSPEMWWTRSGQCYNWKLQGTNNSLKNLTNFLTIILLLILCQVWISMMMIDDIYMRVARILHEWVWCMNQIFLWKFKLISI